MSSDKIYNCNHEWKVLSSDRRDGPGVSACEKCDL